MAMGEDFLEVLRRFGQPPSQQQLPHGRFGMMPGVRQPENPMPVNPANRALLAQYGIGGSALDQGSGVPMGAGPAPRPPARAPQNTSVTNAVPSAPTDAYSQGEVVAPSIAGGAQPPATTPGLFDRDTAQRSAEMNFALGMGGRGSEQADAMDRMKYADTQAGVDNKRMDWASQAARAIRMGGGAYERAQAQKNYDLSRQGQAGELQKLKYAIERIRRGEDPETADIRSIDAGN